jgi:hypothetical protein
MKAGSVEATEEEEKSEVHEGENGSMDACVNNFKTQIHPSFQSIQPNRKL